MRVIRRIVKTVETTKTKKRVAAYVRVSKPTKELLHSFVAQVNYYTDFINNSPEWEFVGVYSDKGITGTMADVRDGYNALIEACESGEVDMVITKSISRFGRNTLDLLKTVRRLKELGVDVFFEKENIHSAGSDGELLLSLLASFAQEESRSISENVKWSIHKRYEQGRPHVTRRAFGYQWDGESYKVVKDEAEAVRNIFKWYLDGDSLATVAKRLAEAGVVGVNGNPIPEKTLHDMIRNEIYIGNLVLQKKYSENHLTKKNVRNYGELPKYRVEDAHEAIITKELFEAVQVAIASRKGNTTNQFVNPTCYSGKVVCGRCGFNCRRMTQRNAKERIKVWRCRKKEFEGVAGCNSKNAYESELDAATINIIGSKELVDEKVSQFVVYDDKIEIVLKNGEVKKWQRK